MARQLNATAGVPEGPCGVEELKQFQRALGWNYQLLVMCRSRPFFVIFKGPDAPNQIRLIKSDQHYDGCTSFPAFANWSYCCLKCEKGYNVEDVKNHLCRGTECRACGRKGLCPPSIAKRCDQCFLTFNGKDCIAHHIASGQCQKYRKCLKCKAEYAVIEGKRHKCRYAQCSVCKTF